MLIIASCEVINPDEGIPTFVRVDKVDFSVKPGEGTDSAEISDIWMYVDGKSIGAYEMPVVFPVLESGSHSVELRFGVKLNGIAATRTINPFFVFETMNLDFVPGDTLFLHPKTKYDSRVKFVWNSIGQEGFEDGGISIDSVAGTTTKITKTAVEVYEGSFSGQIHLDQSHTKYIGQSSKKFDLPKEGKAVVMELHCKNTSNHFAIGMFVEDKTGKITIVNHLVVNPGPDWKKLYVNFTELVSHYPQAKSFRVFFTAELETMNTTTDIFLDNIKLMHY
jgi:hypothetical protein